MEEKPEPLPTEDLLQFLRAALLIGSGETLSGVAKKLGLSSSTISLLLDRIEDTYGKRPLFDRKAGGGGGTGLTELGRELVGSVVQAFREVRMKQPRMVIACSHSLITNQILNRTLSEFSKTKDGENIRLGVHLETKLRFSELLRRLQDRKVDVAILWGTSQRNGRNPSGVERASLSEYPFDLVFISHDSTLIRKLNELVDRLPSIKERAQLFAEVKPNDQRLIALKACLGRRRVATLGEDAQPLRGLFPRADSIDEGETIQVDTYDAALAVVRAKIADVALVPAIYPLLSRARALGQIDYSEAVDELSLGVWYAQGGALRESAEAFVAALRPNLRDFPRRVPAELASAERLPEDLEEYRRLRFGYYVCRHRQNDQEAADSFVWGWESLAWDPIAPNADVLRGRSINWKQIAYHLEARRRKGAFVIDGKRLDEGTVADDVDEPSFVSTFTLMSKQPFRIYGTWTAFDGDIASIYASILSEDRLELSDVRSLQESIRYRSVLSSENGIGFENQPGKS